MSTKTIFFSLGWVVAILTIIFLGFGQNHADANNIIMALKTKCADFATQKDAQAYAEANPQVDARLDRNHDGAVCQTLK